MIIVVRLWPLILSFFLFTLKGLHWGISMMWVPSSSSFLKWSFTCNLKRYPLYDVRECFSTSEVVREKWVVNMNGRAKISWFVRCWSSHYWKMLLLQSWRYWVVCQESQNNFQKRPLMLKINKESLIFTGRAKAHIAPRADCSFLRPIFQVFPLWVHNH